MHQNPYFRASNQQILHLRGVTIVETKGREEDDDKLKFERLQKWCEDVNNRQSRVEYKALYIKQEEWEKYNPKNFSEAIRLFGQKTS